MDEKDRSKGKERKRRKLIADRLALSDPSSYHLSIHLHLMVLPEHQSGRNGNPCMVSDAMNCRYDPGQREGCSAGVKQEGKERE